MSGVDLPQKLSDTLGVDRQQAESVLGSILTSVRMAVDPATFSRVIEAMPDAEQWMLALTFAGGRTGEIVALAGPEGLRRQLKTLGLDDKQIKTTGTTVGDALRHLLPKDAAEKITKRISLLQ